MRLPILESKPQMPETDMNIIMGHGGMTVEAIQKINKLRHVVEFFVPHIRKDNAAYYQSGLDFSQQEIPEHLERINHRLKRRHGFLPGVSLELYLKGRKLDEGAVSDFAFSDVAAYATAMPTDPNTGAERTQWGFLVVNDSNDTTSLIYAETSTLDGQESLDKVAAIDVETGKAYDADSYDLEGQSNLHVTVERVFENLRFELSNPSERFTVTELGRTAIQQEV